MPHAYPPIIDGLVRTVKTVIRRRSGVLVGLTVAAPVLSDDLAVQLGRCLAAEGLVGVDIRVVPGTGPHRILAVEFEE